MGNGQFCVISSLFLLPCSNYYNPGLYTFWGWYSWSLLSLPTPPALPDQLLYIVAIIILKKLFHSIPLFQGIRHFSVAWQIKSKLFGQVFNTFVFLVANLINAPELPPGPGHFPHCLSLILSLLCGPFFLHAIYLPSIPCLLCLTWLGSVHPSLPSASSFRLPPAKTSWGSPVSLTSLSIRNHTWHFRVINKSASLSYPVVEPNKEKGTWNINSIMKKVRMGSCDLPNAKAAGSLTFISAQNWTTIP